MGSKKWPLPQKGPYNLLVYNYFCSRGRLPYAQAVAGQVWGGSPEDPIGDALVDLSGKGRGPCLVESLRQRSYMWGPWFKSVGWSSDLSVEMDLLVTELQQPCGSAHVSGCWPLGWGVGTSSAAPDMPGVGGVVRSVEARQLFQELFAPVH